MNVDDDTLDGYIRIDKPVTLKGLQDVLLDVSQEEDRDIVSQTPENILDVKSNAKYKVLVAEDVKTNQRIAIEMLQLLGCDVDIAENGQAAFESCTSRNYSIIFMDCQMPVLDGYQATRKIRTFESEHSRPPTPIIALTAGSGDEDRNLCFSAGMNGYINKPFSLVDIKHSLDQFVDLEIRDLNFASPARVETESNLDSKSNASVKNQPSHFEDSDVLNLAAINSIRGIEEQTGKPLLPHILEGYIEQMLDKMIELEKNVQAQDSTSLYKTAHAMKSMSANIGAEKVRYICWDLENRGKQADLDNIDSKVSQLKAAYQEFLQEFR